MCVKSLLIYKLLGQIRSKVTTLALNKPFDKSSYVCIKEVISDKRGKCLQSISGIAGKRRKTPNCHREVF